MTTNIAKTNTIRTQVRIAFHVFVLALVAGTQMSMLAQAGSGTKAADDIVERVETQKTSSTDQEKLVKEISEAAKKAGEDHPDDADAVKKAVKDKLDEIRDRQSRGNKPGGKRNKEVREWVKQLKRELMDEGYVTLTAAPGGAGSAKGEEIGERVEAEKTSSTDQDKLVKEIADAAREAGEDNPADPDAVKDAVKAKLDEIRDRPSTPGKPGGKTNQEIEDWVKELKRSLMRGSYVSFTPPAGSRLLLTGTVVADREATATVVDPNGQTLEGVVVEIDGEPHVSDRNGRVVFTAMAAGTTLTAILPHLHGGSPVQASVTESVANVATQAPVIESAPTYATPGEPVTVTGSGFDGVAAGNTVEIGGQPADVLAASPNELIVTTPQPETYGHQPVTVATENGVSQPADMSVIGISLESVDTNLRRGQKGKARIVVTGADSRVPIRIRNLAPQVVSLRGGETQDVRTSGGRDNGAKIQFTAQNPGTFQIHAEVAEPNPR